MITSLVLGLALSCKMVAPPHPPPPHPVGTARCMGRDWVTTDGVHDVVRVTRNSPRCGPPRLEPTTPPRTEVLRFGLTSR